MPPAPTWFQAGGIRVAVNGTLINPSGVSSDTIDIVQAGATGAFVNGRYQVTLAATGGGGGGGGGAGGLGGGAAIVKVATTANIALSGTPSIDGVALSADDLVAVKNQTTGSQNGIYSVSAGAWARATLFDDNAELYPGLQIYVLQGTVNGDKLLSVRNDSTINLGVDTVSIGPVQPLIDSNLSIGGHAVTDVGSIVAGGSAANASAIADFNSTTQGVLVPRMTATERDAIASPATGLLVYNTNTNQFNYWNGSTWAVVSSTGASASIAVVDLATTSDHALTGLTDIDGVTPTAGWLVLANQQANPIQNGVYVAAAGAWARSTSFDEGSELFPGLYFHVKRGTTYADALFSVRNDAVPTVDTDAITILPFGGGGAGSGGTGTGLGVVRVKAATTGDHGLTGLTAVDGVSLADNDLVAVHLQSDPIENGIYLANTSAWTRSPLFDTGTELLPGQQFFVLQGTKYADTLFCVENDATIAVGSAAITMAPVQPVIDRPLDMFGNTFVGADRAAIGTDAVALGAVLELNSTTAGFLPPRMTTAQRDAIATPPEGLVVYNNETDTIDYYTGSVWLSLTGGAGGSVTTFLALTDTPADYSVGGNRLAAINDGATALNFVTESQVRVGDTLWIGDSVVAIGAGNPGNSNLATAAASVFIGVNAGASITGQQFNTFVGAATGALYTASFDNTSIGANAGIGHAGAGPYNTHVGSEAGRHSLGGSESNTSLGRRALRGVEGVSLHNKNVGVGAEAGKDITVGIENTLVGAEAGYILTAGSYNVLLGAGAGLGASGSSEYQFNTHVGWHAGQYSITNVSGTANRNTSVGAEALRGQSGQTYGSDNTAIGAGAGRDVTVGTFNTFIGRAAGQLNTDGFGNVFIGAGAGDNATSHVFSIVVGADEGNLPSLGSRTMNLGATVKAKTDTKNVIVGTSTTFYSGVSLHLTDKSKAFLTNVMNTAERDAIPAPLSGMLIFNSDTLEFNFYDTAWSVLAGGGGGGGGVDTFLELTDAPSSYATHSYKLVNVNATPNALEFAPIFVDPATTKVRIGGSGQPTGDVSFRIASTTLPFMPPVLDSTARDAISTKEAGMVIYNSTTGQVEYWTGSAWQGSAGATSFLGLSDVPEPDYVGHANQLLAVTNAADGVEFRASTRVEASHTLYMDSSNVSIGQSNPMNIGTTTTTNSVVVGNNAAALLSSAVNVTAIGDNAAAFLTTGSSATVIGNGAGGSGLTTQTGCIAIGAGATIPGSSGNNFLNLGATIHGTLLAPRISIGGTVAAYTDGATLALRATDGGFLPNSLTTGERNAISTPATGLMVYNSTTAQHEWYNGSTWEAFGSGGGGSSTFLGLTDVDEPDYTGHANQLVAVNSGATAMQFRTATRVASDATLYAVTNVVALGAGTPGGSAPSASIASTFLGANAGDTVDGGGVTAATLVGFNAGPDMTTGDSNTLIGASAGGGLTTQNNCTAVGNAAKVPASATDNFVNLGNAFWGYGTSSAQKFVIGNQTGSQLPTGNAILRIEGTHGAFVPPKLSTANRGALTPEEGFTIYNTTTDQIEVYADGVWRPGGVREEIVFFGTATANIRMDDSASAGNGADLWLEAQAKSAASSTGGDLVLYGGEATGSSSTGGNVFVRGGDGTSADGIVYVGQTSSNVIEIGDGALLGFYGASPASKPSVTGSRGSNAALTSLCAALATLGLITNSTTS